MLHAAMLEYQLNPQKDPYANVMLQGFPINETIGIVLSMVYLKPEMFPPAFEPFYSINTTSDSTTLSTYYEFLATQGSVDLPRYAFSWPNVRRKIKLTRVGSIYTPQASPQTRLCIIR